MGHTLSCIKSESLSSIEQHRCHGGGSVLGEKQYSYCSSDVRFGRVKMLIFDLFVSLQTLVNHAGRSSFDCENCCPSHRCFYGRFVRNCEGFRRLPRKNFGHLHSAANFQPTFSHFVYPSQRSMPRFFDRNGLWES